MSSPKNNAEPEFTGVLNESQQPAENDEHHDGTPTPSDRPADAAHNDEEAVGTPTTAEPQEPQEATQPVSPAVVVDAEAASESEKSNGTTTAPVEHKKDDTDSTGGPAEDHAAAPTASVEGETSSSPTAEVEGSSSSKKATETTSSPKQPAQEQKQQANESKSSPATTTPKTPAPPASIYVYETSLLPQTTTTSAQEASSTDPSTSSVAFECIDGVDYYYIALELPGVTSIANVDVLCTKTLTGYELNVHASKHSAFLRECEPIIAHHYELQAISKLMASTNTPAAPANDAEKKKDGEDGSAAAKEAKRLVSTRNTGTLVWAAHVKGVFCGGPEKTLKDGVLKLRIPKRLAKEEKFVVVDF